MISWSSVEVQWLLPFHEVQWLLPLREKWNHLKKSDLENWYDLQQLMMRLFLREAIINNKLNSQNSHEKQQALV